MALAPFSTTEFNSVRACIAVNLTADALPDSVISLEPFAGEAIRRVERLLSDAQITANTVSAQTAAVYFCASLLCGSVTQVERETIVGGELWWQLIDPVKRAKELRELGESICAEIDSIDANGDLDLSLIVPRMFVLANSGVGKTIPATSDSFNIPNLDTGDGDW